MQISRVFYKFRKNEKRKQYGDYRVRPYYYCSFGSFLGYIRKYNHGHGKSSCQYGYAPVFMIIAHSHVAILFIKSRLYSTAKKRMSEGVSRTSCIFSILLHLAQRFLIQLHSGSYMPDFSFLLCWMPEPRLWN